MSNKTVNYTTNPVRHFERYEDWADRVRAEKMAVPEMSEQDGSSESYLKAIRQRQLRESAISYNRKIDVERRKMREEQVKAYRLDEFESPRLSEEDARNLRRHIEEQNKGKNIFTVTDPKHLSEDADFYDIDKEGIDLILVSPNENIIRYKMLNRNKYGWTDSDIFGNYCREHLNPFIKDGSQADRERYMQKAFTMLPPTYTPEELADERKKQFGRDDQEAANAIDALLKARS